MLPTNINCIKKNVCTGSSLAHVFNNMEVVHLFPHKCAHVNICLHVCEHMQIYFCICEDLHMFTYDHICTQLLTCAYSYEIVIYHVYIRPFQGYDLCSQQLSKYEKLYNNMTTQNTKPKTKIILKEQNTIPT